MVFNLSEYRSIGLEFLSDLRNVATQKDRMRFRTNMERLGTLMAYEISKTMQYKENEVQTPLAAHNTHGLSDYPVLVTIMRAGIPFTNGFLHAFDKSDVGFVGAFREEADAGVKVHMGYVTVPSLSGKDVILIDPMLATGSSIVRVIDDVLIPQNPRTVTIASIIAAPEGINHVDAYVSRKKISSSLWTWAIDENLNDDFFIVPGLGDAGDLSFGKK